MFNDKSDYSNKKTLYLRYHCRGSKCETTKRKSWPETLFQLLTFTFDPFFNIKWGYVTTKALYLLLFSIITDFKVGDNRCAAVAFCVK